MHEVESSSTDMVELRQETPRLLFEAVEQDLDPDDLVDYLYRDRAISEDELQMLETFPTRKRKCRYLVNRLCQRPEPRRNFEAFVRALDSAKYGFLVPDVKSVLDKDLSASIRTNSNPATTTTTTTTTTAEARNPEVDWLCIQYMPPAGGGLAASQKVLHIFNRLSSLLNSGKVLSFTLTCEEILRQNGVNRDVGCIVKYLQACRHSINNQLSAGKSAIQEGKVISRRTSSPVQYMVLLLTCQSWMYTKSRKFEKLKSCLADAEQMIAANRVLCQGMAAGWIYVNKAKYMQFPVSSKHPDKAAGIIKWACCLLDKSLEQFQREKSIDREYGYVYTLILKATFLLRCGCMMGTVSLPLQDDDISDAESLLMQADSSDIGLPPVLRASYSIAMADLNLRRGSVVRAREYAEEALSISLSDTLVIPECSEQANARLTYLTLLENRDAEKRNVVSTCRLKNPFCKTAKPRRMIGRKNPFWYNVLLHFLRWPKWCLTLLIIMGFIYWIVEHCKHAYWLFQL